jgi:16S rRNA (cytosine1402-N4)-methyltransferase
MLRLELGGCFVDCTLGAGGHSEAFLEASSSVEVIGIDRDPAAVGSARSRLKGFGSRFTALHANFKELDNVLASIGRTRVEGVLADLGVSSMQLDTAARGFSFQQDAPLDMRMDPTKGETAAELINRLPEAELAGVIFKYGEEQRSRRIARAIAVERGRQEIRTTRQLADLVVRALGTRGRWRVHPATKTFQAIRIAVNGELDGLDEFVSKAIDSLKPEGRLAVISFHSLEDRIIKLSFRRESGRCICSEQGRPSVLQTVPGELQDQACSRCGARRRVHILTRKPVRPGPDEVRANPRSRSARLRVCERDAQEQSG